MAASTRDLKAGNLHGTAYTVENKDARIEVWPFLGFNCVRWDQHHNGTWHDILYRTSEILTNPVPTRNGHPVLFPFPNRMKHGRFTFENTEYQLPLTDNSGQHSIHGFTPRLPWRVIDVKDDAITGEFQLSKDAPQFARCWPADARLRLTYRLVGSDLQVDAEIDAADGKAMPFGLGYHPYFTLGGDLKDWQLQCPVGSLWNLENNFLTGTKQPPAGDYDFRQFRKLGNTTLDHAYGDLAMPTIAVLTNGNRTLTIDVDRAFRELLLFIPAHRQAIAIEPYTCTTDAANLEKQGMDVGWRVLPVGKSFQASVNYRHRFV